MCVINYQVNVSYGLRTLNGLCHQQYCSQREKIEYYRNTHAHIVTHKLNKFSLFFCFVVLYMQTIPKRNSRYFLFSIFLTSLHVHRTYTLFYSLWVRIEELCMFFFLLLPFFCALSLIVFIVLVFVCVQHCAMHVCVRVCMFCVLVQVPVHREWFSFLTFVGITEPLGYRRKNC